MFLRNHKLLRPGKDKVTASPLTDTESFLTENFTISIITILGFVLPLKLESELQLKEINQPIRWENLVQIKMSTDDWTLLTLIFKCRI